MRSPAFVHRARTTLVASAADLQTTAAATGLGTSLSDPGLTHAVRLGTLLTGLLCSQSNGTHMVAEAIFALLFASFLSQRLRSLSPQHRFARVCRAAHARGRDHRLHLLVPLCALL